MLFDLDPRKHRCVFLRARRRGLAGTALRVRGIGAIIAAIVAGDNDTRNKFVKPRPHAT